MKRKNKDNNDCGRVLRSRDVKTEFSDSKDFGNMNLRSRKIRKPEMIEKRNYKKHKDSNGTAAQDSDDSKSSEMIESASNTSVSDVDERSESSIHPPTFSILLSDSD